MCPMTKAMKEGIYSQFTNPISGMFATKMKGKCSGKTMKMERRPEKSMTNIKNVKERKQKRYVKILK